MLRRDGSPGVQPTGARGEDKKGRAAAPPLRRKKQRPSIGTFEARLTAVRLLHSRRTTLTLCSGTQMAKSTEPHARVLAYTDRARPRTGLVHPDSGV